MGRGPLIRTEKIGDSHYILIYGNGAKLGELSKSEDGYFYWWPNYFRQGCWPSDVLREIAQLLEVLNHPWDEQIKKEFGDDAAVGHRP